MSAPDAPGAPGQVELSIILPAYNEGPAITKAVERYAHVLPGLNRNFEVIVIDDGSTDDTLARAQEVAKDRSFVRVIQNDRNRGQVFTIQHGFAESRGEIMLHNGVDLPLEPNDTEAVLNHFDDGADVVVIERSNRHAYGLIRKFVSLVNITIVRLLFRSPVSDHNFAQAYRRKVIDQITVETTGVSTVTTELILKSAALGFRVDSIPLTYHERQAGTTTVNMRSTVHTMMQLLRLRKVMSKHRAANRK